MTSTAPLILGLKKLAKNKWAVVSLCIIFVYVFFASLSIFEVSFLDFSQNLGKSFSPPSADHWFGTDFLGRSVLKKVIYGAYVALSVGLISSVIAIPVGTFLGLISGYFGRRIDDFVVWFYSTVDSIPEILLLLAISFVLGRGIFSIYVAVGLTSWVGICRLVRAEVLKQKEKEYVLAARALGATDVRIMFVHILPNILHLVIIDFSLRFIYAIKSEAILSYLGLGVQGKPSWGIMISDAKGELLEGHWWQLTFATLAMFFLVLALNFLGDALRDALDPKTKS